MKTLAAAEKKIPTTMEDPELAHGTWQKFLKDVEANRAGKPVDVDQVCLDDQLLVDTFGIWERHSGGEWKIRVINNFRANLVNDHAWMPSKLRYSGYGELRDASALPS